MWLTIFRKKEFKTDAKLRKRIKHLQLILSLTLHKVRVYDLFVS